MNPPDISLVVFNPRWDELESCLTKLEACQSEFRHLNVLVSGSTENGERAAEIITAVGLMPSTSLVHRYDNLGFASGHNLLLGAAFDSNADSCLVLNPDVSVAPGAISDLCRIVGRLNGQDLYGPSLSQGATEPKRFDSLGIRWTATGRHFDAKQAEVWDVTPGRSSDVAGLTGACLLVRSTVYNELVERCGYFFDDRFLAYREDAELGIRASAYGIGSTVIEVEGFAHSRHVRGSRRTDTLANLLGVRNRFLMRWTLGRLRPGMFGLPTLRDLGVVAAVLFRERSSLPGLVGAIRIRRSSMLRRRRLR